MALDPITGIADLANTVGGIISKFIPDKTEAAKASAELQGKLMDMIAMSDKAQSEVNAVEAQSSNAFVAGWRPFIGWVCGTAFAWQFVGQPVFSFFYTLVTKQPSPVVALDMDMLMTVLLGMLGLGAMHSYEKVKGVA